MVRPDRLSKDWAVGEREFKKELLKAHGDLAGAAERGEAGPRELAMEVWRGRLDALLAALKKNTRDIADDPKGEPWKVAVAAAMKRTTTASNPWLAQALGMGSQFHLSRLASACRASPAPFQAHLDRITKRKVCPLFPASCVRRFSGLNGRRELELEGRREAPASRLLQVDAADEAGGI